jgi:hypothetical protein
MPSRAKSNAVIGSNRPVFVGGAGGLYQPPVPEIGLKMNPTPIKKIKGGMKGLKFM